MNKIQINLFVNMSPSKAIRLIILLWILLGNPGILSAQNNLVLHYDRDNSLAGPTYSRITLKRPNGNLVQLFADTAKKTESIQKGILCDSGKYVLNVSFNSEKYGNNSIRYEFNLSGSEVKTDIYISFSYNNRLYKSGNIWKKGKCIPNGYVRIEKLYSAPSSVEIKYCPSIKSSEYYKEPFFMVKNNSKDTIYGDFDPGYLWGSLSVIVEGKVLKTSVGILDGNFVENPPLYPDSTKIASVGSFGMFRKMPLGRYIFELKYSTKDRTRGIEIYKENNAFAWWAGTKEYYVLKCNFEVKE